jgi:hypothetical protein
MTGWYDRWLCLISFDSLVDISGSRSEDLIWCWGCNWVRNSASHWGVWSRVMGLRVTVTDVLMVIWFYGSMEHD